VAVLDRKQVVLIADKPYNLVVFELMPDDTVLICGVTLEKEQR